MSALPLLYLARHGETAWTVSRQHTGRTDLPLTERGEQNARRMAERLAKVPFARVFASPLVRARRTGELAGFGSRLEIDPDLYEWNYGDYEGKKTAEIRQERPGWDLFQDGCPNGETAADVGRRADRFLAKVRGLEGNVLVFSSAHLLRTLTARWLGLPPELGRLFLLGTATLSILGYEHDRAEPVIRLWNDDTLVAGD